MSIAKLSLPTIPSRAITRAMPYDAFSHVNHWIFDLDNTLYPPEVRLFDQIEVLMIKYMTRELKIDEDVANEMRGAYWKKYGTTMSGLMHEHDIDPMPFLKEVHQIDLDVLQPAPDLRDAIIALPGRKIIYTNGSREHADRVSAARGLSGVFDAHYGVEDAGFAPKPDAEAFAVVFEKDKVNTKTAAMFEDDIRNLSVPHQLGMKTVLVGPIETAEHVQHQTTDLAGFLGQLSAPR